MKNLKTKIKKASERCSICLAEFEVELNNANLSDERKELISRHIMKYCPVCKVADERL